MSTLLNALKESGITVKEVETVKNGVSCTGYQIDTGTNIKPVVYYSPDETIEAFVARVCEIAKKPVPQVDVEMITSRKYLLEKSFICLQKKGGEEICKRSFLDLEMYVRVGVDIADGTGTIKVTPEMVERAGITEDDLFRAAQENSEEKAQILSMAEAIGLDEAVMGANPFYVASYPDKAHGAGLLAVNKVLHDFCATNGFGQIYILPSSTEEILLLPVKFSDPETLAAMVNSVNAETVDPLLQLNPTAYLYDDNLETVTIACAYE